MKNSIIYQMDVPRTLKIISPVLIYLKIGQPLVGLVFVHKRLPAGDNEQEATRSLSYHRKVAVFCIEALGSWLLLECCPLRENQLPIVLDLLETVCINASSLLVSWSIANFDVRASLANLGAICGSIFCDVESPSRFWRANVSDIVRNSWHCAVLMKPMLRFCEVYWSVT